MPMYRNDIVINKWYCYNC